MGEDRTRHPAGKREDLSAHVAHSRSSPQARILAIGSTSKQSPGGGPPTSRCVLGNDSEPASGRAAPRLCTHLRFRSWSEAATPRHDPKGVNQQRALDGWRGSSYAPAVVRAGDRCLFSRRRGRYLRRHPKPPSVDPVLYASLRRDGRYRCTQAECSRAWRTVRWLLLCPRRSRPAPVQRFLRWESEQSPCPVAGHRCMVPVSEGSGSTPGRTRSGCPLSQAREAPEGSSGVAFAVKALVLARSSSVVHLGTNHSVLLSSCV